MKPPFLLLTGHDLPRDCLPKPGQKRDCLCGLPDTLLSHVLSFVGDLCSAVALLLRVSKGYRAFAAGHPILWAHITTGRVVCTPLGGSLRSLLARCCGGSLVSLQVGYEFSPGVSRTETPSQLTAILAVCRSLERLVLSRCWLDETVFSAMARCSTRLQHLDLSESSVSHVGLLRCVLPRLESLSVQSVLLTEEAITGIGRSIMTLLRPPLGRLSSLTLVGDDDDGQDAVTAVVEELLPRSPSEQEGGEEQGPPPWLLRELVLKDCTVLAASLLSDHRLPSSLCHLERLCLNGRTCIMPEALLAHLPRVATLRSIEFKGRSRCGQKASGPQVRRLVEGCRLLQHLDLRSLGIVADDLPSTFLQPPPGHSALPLTHLTLPLAYLPSLPKQDPSLSALRSLVLYGELSHEPAALAEETSSAVLALDLPSLIDLSIDDDIDGQARATGASPPPDSPPASHHRGWHITSPRLRHLRISGGRTILPGSITIHPGPPPSPSLRDLHITPTSADINGRAWLTLLATSLATCHLANLPSCSSLSIDSPGLYLLHLDRLPRLDHLDLRCRSLTSLRVSGTSVPSVLRLHSSTLPALDLGEDCGWVEGWRLREATVECGRLQRLGMAGCCTIETLQVRAQSWLKEVDLRGCKGMQALSIDDGKVEGVRHELADLQLDGCEALRSIRMGPGWWLSPRAKRGLTYHSIAHPSCKITAPLASTASTQGVSGRASGGGKAKQARTMGLTSPSPPTLPGEGGGGMKAGPWDEG